MVEQPGYLPEEFGSVSYENPLIEINPHDFILFNSVHDKYKNDISPSRIDHILNGDGPDSGGHLSGTVNPGKSEFPAAWDEDKIIGVIVSITKDTNGNWVQQGGPATGSTYSGSAADLPRDLLNKRGNAVRFSQEVVVEGVTVKVVVEPGGEGIITGFPTGGDGVYTNPE